jgi:predicted permease
MGLLSRLKNSFRKSTANKDAADELAWHLEQRVQEYMRQGMGLEEARAAARKRMGNLTSLEETTVESDLIVWLDAVKRDVILAARMLRRAPTVTAVAILSLGLGIGANTVVFTLMKQVMLDYLPVPAPEQLVILHNQEPELGYTSSNDMKSYFSNPLYRDLNAGTSQIFDGILAFFSTNVSLSGRESTETVQGGLVSGNFFQVLHVAPWRGRLFTAGDDQKPGASPVAVLGYGLWMRSFGGDPGIVNRKIVLNKHSYVVIGVTPPQFYGIDVSTRADLYVPLSMKANVMPDKLPLTDRLHHWLHLIGRLKPGVNANQAAAALSTIYPPLRDQDLAFMKSPSEEFKKVYAKKRVELSNGGQGYASLRDNLSNPLKILMAMVGIVLLITTANVANLLVARGVARQREMAIRLSVGAGKATLARQLLIESLLLAMLGGCLGIAIAYAGTPALLHALSFDLSSASISARPDGYVMLLAAAVTLAVGLIFGLLPAWQSARTDVASALKTEGSFGHTGHAGWLRRVLVVAQVALSLVLVTSAILFTCSLRNLKNINVGFKTAQLVKFEIDPSQAGYSQPRIKAFGEELRRKLASLPGVESAAAVTIPLLENDDGGGEVTVEGAPPQRHGNSGFRQNLVSPGFFSTMQIPLLAGRQFTATDSLPTTKVAIVNETFVKHFLPGRNPLGVHFGFGAGDAVKMTETIVGVVADSEHTTIRSKIQSFVYMPYLADSQLSSLTFYVRTRASEKAVALATRNLVRQMAPDLPVNRLSSMTEIIDQSLFVERSLGYLSIGFAALATLLAIVGLYGVMSYSVTSRYRELGIRMAIGATPEVVLTMVLRESAYLGIAGALCGIPFVLGSASYIGSSLYGVQPQNPLIWGISVAALIAVALFAGFVPAWHAAHIDPHTALRAE